MKNRGNNKNKLDNNRKINQTLNKQIKGQIQKIKKKEM